MHRRIAMRVALCAAPVLLAACFIRVSSGVLVRERDKSALPFEVRTPVKAHLLDGSTVVYHNGIRVFGNAIVARVGGVRVGPLNQEMRLGQIALDSVVGLESFHERVDIPGSVVLSTLATAVSTVGSVAAAVVLFGSCPTIYADSGGTAVLQAEVFASRISPLLEARDIDLLAASPDSTGALTLEVRNEALETHYINHFELLEVRHARDRQLIPDEHGRPLLIPRTHPVSAARDRAGRDIADALARVDGNVFSTDSATLARASGSDPFDHIDLTMPRPAGDSAVVTVHLRNSLLTTVLLYDMMLGRAGARSLDWLARDMRRIGPMFTFGRWYRQHFGLRVWVFDGKSYREIERHPTYGPVAWRDAATVVPVLQSDSLRVRLSFAADEWRIDQVGVADSFERARTRVIGIGSVRAVTDSVARETRKSIRAADERYLQTLPGQRFWMTFQAGPAPRDSARSFLLASQGYYSEWIRGSWVQQATDSVTFKPSALALDQTFRAWNAQRQTIDTAFFGARIGVERP